VADGAGCVVTDLPVLDDGIECTAGRCDEATRTVVQEPSEFACDDGNICTQDICSPLDGCTSVVLLGGGPCDGTVGFCDAAGECGACADTVTGDIDVGCTADAPDCVAGACSTCSEESEACPLDCAGVPGGASREDLCGVCDDDPATDCLGLCDGVPCGALCDGSLDGECDDGNPCTADACTDGRCTNDPELLDGESCDDGSVCSVTSVCDSGVCVLETALDCESTCTSECDPVRGCRPAPRGTVCDDGDPLTNRDFCNGAATGSEACAGVCDDGNPCTWEYEMIGPVVVGCMAPEPLPAGLRVNISAPEPCTTEVCDGEGNVVETVNAACLACEPSACTGACYTGNCGPDGCEPQPAGTLCDDGLEDTTDACDGRGNCVGSCPATECGQRLNLSGVGGEVCGPIFEISLDGGTSCPDDDNPCTVARCSADGTCEQVLRSEGSSCDHPCGGGVCSDDGVCELEDDQCADLLGACWQDAACNEESSICEGEPLDPYCEQPGAYCVENWGFCRGPSPTCGDGVCDWQERTYGCTTTCAADCGTPPGTCYARVIDRQYSSAYQAFASSAYGFEPAHQNVAVTQMLSDGLRFFHQVIDYCEIGADSGDVCLCSGDNNCPSIPIRLRTPLAELREALDADPAMIVVLHFPHNYVSAAALVAEVEAAGLLPYTYRRTRGIVGREPWDLYLPTMVNKNKRVVIFGPGFVSNDNILYLTNDAAPDLADDDYRGGLAGAFDPDVNEPYACADAWGEYPEPNDPRFISARHITSGPSPSWIASACYHKFRRNHTDTCTEVWPDDPLWIHAMPFEFYNASVHGTNYHDSANIIYPDRCLDDVQGCFTDDDCTVGECGGLFICLECVDGSDCDADEWCDTGIGVCSAPQADGAFCTSDRQCSSDRCEFFVCQSCRTNEDCTETQYCDAFGGCQEKKFNGVGCLTNVECISDICRPAIPIGAFCVECIGADGCDSDEYCDNNPAPGDSACQPKKDIGAFCIADVECTSGNCHATVCSECDALEDCAADEYCTLDLIAPIESVCQQRAESGEGCASNVECLSGNCIGFTCVDTCSDHPECGDGRWCDGIGICQDELPNGDACIGDVECESGNCYLGFCVACDEQSDCSADTFCTLDPLPGASACIDPKAIGEVCVQPFECASDACLFGFCVACDSQDDCSGNTFCTLDPLPGASTCIATKSIGEICVQPFECASGACFAGFCVACDSQDDCPGVDSFCSLDPAPGESACISTKPIGGICAQNFECESGNCWATVCSECNEHSDCAGDEYCTLDLTPPINSTCEPKKGINEACLSGVECLADACVGFRCGECGTDAQCPSNEHCNTIGECVSDLAEDAVCLRNSMCLSNACAEGFCAECVGDAGCPTNQHCNTLNECAPDLAENAPCLRNSFCSSGFCVAGFCAECASDANCAANQHCNALNECAADVGNNSPCLRDSFCSTGICSAGFCAECTDDLDCAANRHCNVGGDCQADYANNVVCTRNAECSTGICEAGFCAQCRNDAGCSTNQHCNAGNDCANDVGNNSACLRDSFCTTGICNAGFCAECESDGDCPSNEHCNALLDCQADYSNNTVCTRNGECSTGICEAGFCAQCRGDGDCPSSQHCNAVNDCADDVGNNAPCLRNAFCSTGICSAGFCAECISHGDCNSNEYCNAGGDCIAKRGTGGACVTNVECTGGCCSFVTCGGFGC
jgi:hypothetical protein